MPYLDTVGDIVRVSAYFSYPNSQVQIIDHHFQCTTAGPNDTRGALASQIATTINTNIIPTLNMSVLFKGILVHLVKTVNPVLPAVFSISTPGIRTENTLPTQVRAVLSWYTDMQGVAFRGRNYMPTPSEGFTANTGHPGTGYITSVNAYGGSLLNPFVITGSSWKLGVFHRKPSGLVTTSFTPILEYQASGLWGTQHRSGDYGKLNKLPPQLP